VVTETVQLVPEGEVEITPPIPISPTLTKSPVEEKAPHDDSPLRQRLKSAMHKATL
jgi:hypothetical protein